ncbi:hypothetical protein Psuf_051540 [Phytohabitans suffuscus]|uniref:Uncharacterized protein n=1 Tax=Phytohabitans suffuscus TaxID=624315 RepID=A0A6F8YPD5_9ACTN|nr:hypothetical protein Psuf_051540 [Phytohabitans suffuscus]
MSYRDVRGGPDRCSRSLTLRVTQPKPNLASLRDGPGAVSGGFDPDRCSRCLTLRGPASTIRARVRPSRRPHRLRAWGPVTVPDLPRPLAREKAKPWVLLAPRRSEAANSRFCSDLHQSTIQSIYAHTWT